jgi:choline dehydrogenase
MEETPATPPIQLAQVAGSKCCLNDHEGPVKAATVTKMIFCALALTVLLCIVPSALAVPVGEKQKRLDATYDYVIVGGGTAGLTLAARLTEDPSTTVAVIEAGSLYEVTNPLLSTMPAGDVIFAGASPLDTNPLVDWNFVTTPQAGANGRKLHYPRGKCLGGR